MKYFLSTILMILFISCDTIDKNSAITYFGGEIINPKSDHILLLKDDKVIDTVALDKNNRFIAEYKDLDEGLYTFKHGVEFQYIYLEPTDSILIRLNTWDFDESIVFSGKGSSKNEFLINLFLQNEKEEYAMYKYFKLNEKEFESKIDSLTNERVLIYNQFKKNEGNVSKGFQKLTNIAIHFPLFRLKEAYPYYYKRVNKLNKYPTVSEKFYDFRNNINLNEEHLISFYPYQNYVISYLYNLSYQLKEEDATKENMTINILNSTIENIELEHFKNTLLKKIVVNDFLKSESTCSINEKTFHVFIENCSNEVYTNQVRNLVNDSKAVKNNKPLQDFKLTTLNDTSSTINKVIKNKNTVIYFWSQEFMSSDYLVSRIQFLEKQYPKILFIGINMQSESNLIGEDPLFKKLDYNKQFKLPKNSEAHNYLTSKYPRTIIVNKKGIVENGFTYLNSKKLNSELKRLELN